jgi:negative elongation factor A
MRVFAILINYVLILFCILFYAATTLTTSTTHTNVAVVTPMVITPVESTPVAVQTVRPAQTVTQIRIQTSAQPNAAANTRKGLSLTVFI